MIASKLSAFGSMAALSSVLTFSFSDGCKKENGGAGLVPDAAVTTTTAPATTATTPQVTDPSQCSSCQLATVAGWSFEGVYRDATCLEPIAQTVTPTCGSVPAPAPASVTYVDTVGGRKAGEAAQVTLKELVGPETPKFRKAGTACVKANEAAVAVTPAACGGQKVCRDANGALACTGCRTLANGCPDYEETRTYASIEDPVAFGGKPTGAGNNLSRLRTCCAAIAAEAKRLGSSPEAGLLMNAAAQCNALVAAAGPNGNAPELAAVRGLLAGRNVPGCM